MAEKRKGESLGKLSSDLAKKQDNISKGIEAIQKNQDEINANNDRIGKILEESIKENEAREKAFNKELNSLKKVIDGLSVKVNKTTAKKTSAVKGSAKNQDIQKENKDLAQGIPPVSTENLTEESIENKFTKRQKKENNDLEKSSKSLAKENLTEESIENKFTKRQKKENNDLEKSSKSLAKGFKEINDELKSLKKRITSLYLFELLRRGFNALREKNKEDNARLNKGLFAGLSVEGVRKIEALGESFGLDKDLLINSMQKIFTDKANMRFNPEAMEQSVKDFLLANTRGGLGLDMNRDILGKTPTELFETIMTKLTDAMKNPEKYNAINVDEVIQNARNAGYGEMAQLINKALLANKNFDPKEILDGINRIVETPANYLQTQQAFNKATTELWNRIENILQKIANALLPIVTAITEWLNTSWFFKTDSEKVDGILEYDYNSGFLSSLRPNIKGLNDKETAEVLRAQDLLEIAIDRNSKASANASKELEKLLKNFNETQMQAFSKPRSTFKMLSDKDFYNFLSEKYEIPLEEIAKNMSEVFTLSKYDGNTKERLSYIKDYQLYNQSLIKSGAIGYAGTSPNFSGKAETTVNIHANPKVDIRVETINQSNGIETTNTIINQR